MGLIHTTHDNKELDGLIFVMMWIQFSPRKASTKTHFTKFHK